MATRQVLAELLAAYEQLVVGRRVNDQNSALVRQGRMAVYPSNHGQEACQVAAARHASISALGHNVPSTSSISARPRR